MTTLKMIDCLCEAFKVARRIYEHGHSKQIRVVIDTDCNRRDILELTEIVKQNQTELKRILKSKSSTEVTDVKDTLRQGSIDIAKYDVSIGRDLIVITPNIVSAEGIQDPDTANTRKDQKTGK